MFIAWNVASDGKIKILMIWALSPFHSQEWLYRFYSNARRFCSSKGDPLGVKGLTEIHSKPFKALYATRHEEDRWRWRWHTCSKPKVVCNHWRTVHISTMIHNLQTTFKHQRFVRRHYTIKLKKKISRSTLSSLFPLPGIPRASVYPASPQPPNYQPMVKAVRKRPTVKAARKRPLRKRGWFTWALMLLY